MLPPSDPGLRPSLVHRRATATTAPRTGGRTDTTPASPSTATSEPALAPTRPRRLRSRPGRRGNEPPRTDAPPSCRRCSRGPRCARAAARGGAAGAASRARRGGRGDRSLGARGADADGRPRCPARPGPRRVEASGADDVGHERLPPPGTAPQGRPSPGDRVARAPRRSAARRATADGRTPASARNARHAADEPDHPASGGRVGRGEVAGSLGNPPSPVPRAGAATRPPLARGPRRATPPRPLRRARPPTFAPQRSADAGSSTSDPRRPPGSVARSRAPTG